MSLPQSVWPKPSRKYDTPSVAISSATASWLTSGRNTSRSITKASATMIAMPSTIGGRLALICFIAASMRHAKVGVDHRLVGADDVRRSVGDLASVIEHDDAIRDVHHDSHVVLDQHDRRSEFVVDVEDEPAH